MNNRPLPKDGIGHGARAPSPTGGQALVQLLIGIAILSIIMGGMASMISKVQLESRAVAEKLAVLNQEMVLKNALGDGAVCRYVLNNPTQLAFNSASLPRTITLPRPATGVQPRLYSSIVAGTPGPVVAEVASPVGSSAVKVRSIQLRINQGSAGSYTGDWLVNYDPTTAVRNLRPATIPVRLRVNDSVPASSTVDDCWGGAGRASSVTGYKMYWDYTNGCRNSPSPFTKSVTADWTSLGDIDLPNGSVPFNSALFEMTIRASSSTTVTQYLRHVYSNVYFYLNGSKIAEETSAGLKNRTITWRFVKGENLVQIVVNTCSAGGPYLTLEGTFFAGHPELQFLR